MPDVKLDVEKWLRAAKAEWGPLLDAKKQEYQRVQSPIGELPKDELRRVLGQEEKAVIAWLKSLTPWQLIALFRSAESPSFKRALGSLGFRQATQAFSTAENKARLFEHLSRNRVVLPDLRKTMALAQVNSGGTEAESIKDIIRKLPRIVAGTPQLQDFVRERVNRAVDEAAKKQRAYFGRDALGANAPPRELTTQLVKAAGEVRLPPQWGMSVYRGEYAAHRAKVKKAEARNTPAQFHPRFEPKRKDYQFAGKRLVDLPVWYLNRLWSNQSLWKSLKAHHSKTYKALATFMQSANTQARLRHHFADPEEGPGGTREVEGSQKWALVDEKKIDRATGEEVKTGRKLWDLVEFNYIEKKVRGDFQPSLDVGESKWRGSRRPTDFEQRPEARTERWQQDLMSVAKGRSGPERKALIAFEKWNREEQVYEMLWERYANPKEEAGSLADQGRVDWHRSRARSLAYEDADLGGLSQIKSLYGNQPGRLTGKSQMYDVFGGLIAAMGDREKLKTWKDEMDQSGFGEHWERDLPALSSHFRRSWNATAGLSKS